MNVKGVKKYHGPPNKSLLLFLHLHNLETPTKHLKKINSFHPYNKNVILAHTFKDMT